MKSLDALPFVLPPGQLAELRAAYATPPRAYHDFAHVEAVLGHFADVARGPGWQQPGEVALAILYHDAIYVAGATDNEVRSAEYAVDALAHWPAPIPVRPTRVAELIALTARHGGLGTDAFALDPDGDDTCLFLDCDMAILGADADTFDAYDRGIATEYRGRVPGWMYRLQRRRFLKALLARPRIFLSDFFHERLDGRARANLRRAITEKR
ncbi:MAG TPA: hypothetical protein VLK29_07045 [Luteimonas sp.]|nr:hypothetical protein [Luteimonas sp.]